MMPSDQALRIKTRAAELNDKLRSIRQHLHRNPELSFKEFKTADYIASFLDSLGLSYRKGIAGTGIVGEIKGKAGGKVVALRADMDALPIREVEGRAHRSLNEGVMHACGHDVHMTCLMGALVILNELHDEFSGTVRFLFQPGEEVLPGGASLMIEEGVLDGVDLIIGQHVQPSMETGTAGFREGMYMASTDEIRISVKGKGGHAAMPADYNNPVTALSDFILRATSAFMGENKNVPSDIPTVLAFGLLDAKGATNVIPETAYAEGTFRTMNEKWREEAHNRLYALAAEVSASHRVSCELTISKGYPFLVNNSDVTGLSKKAAIDYLGAANVDELSLRMTAEDFAWYTQKVPGCFYRLGTGNKEKGICSGVHTPGFDIDEAALVTGAGLLAYIAVRQLLA